MAKTIDDLNRSISQLQKQKEVILMRQKTAERKEIARQKIILGGWLLTNDLARVEEIKVALVRDQDRAAFGLQPLDDKKTLINAEAGVLATVFVPH